jgi:hypothetical protein
MIEVFRLDSVECETTTSRKSWDGRVTEKFITVVSKLESTEPVWFGQERKQETLDECFQTQLSAMQRKRIEFGVRGYVAAIHQQHPAMGCQLSDRIRHGMCRGTFFILCGVRCYVPPITATPVWIDQSASSTPHNDGLS